MQHFDVVIVGGGVIGVTSAYFLRRAGLHVAVLDQGQFGQESSWAGAGIIAAAPAIADAQTPADLLSAHSAVLHAEIAETLRSETGIDNGYSPRGGWAIVGVEDAALIEAYRAAKISCETVCATDLREREPALDPADQTAVFLPGMASVRNPRHIKALLTWCTKHAVALHAGVPVFGFERQGERITAVRTANGTMPAAHFLIASGAWTDIVLRDLGLSAGIEPVRGQIALLATQGPTLTRVVEVGSRYLVPRNDGRVLVGSTEEHVGFVKQTTATAISGLLEFAIRFVPSLAAAALERCWAGLRPGSRSGHPLIGRIPGTTNAYLAAGHYRAGIQLSPGTGLLVKQLVLGETPSIPPEVFHLETASQAAFRP